MHALAQTTSRMQLNTCDIMQKNAQLVSRSSHSRHCWCQLTLVQGVGVHPCMQACMWTWSRYARNRLDVKKDFKFGWGFTILIWSGPQKKSWLNRTRRNALMYVQLLPLEVSGGGNCHNPKGGVVVFLENYRPALDSKHLERPTDGDSEGWRLLRYHWRGS